MKSSAGSSIAYGKWLHGGINISITSNSVYIKLNSSSPPQILVSISIPMSVNYKTFLQLCGILMWLYLPPSSHTSRLSQESLSHFHCVMPLLCSPLTLSVSSSEQLPGWLLLSVLPPQAQTMLSGGPAFNHSEKPSMAACFLPLEIMNAFPACILSSLYSSQDYF